MKSLVLTTLVLSLALLPNISAYAEDEDVVKLLPPHSHKGSQQLMKVLQWRNSLREFNDHPIPDEYIGNLLWAGCGINRPKSGKRTAPSARNQQAIDIYVSMKEGVYLYLPKKHALKLIIKGDHREKTTLGQEYVKNATLNLIYVADRRKMKVSKDKQEFYAATDTGFIAQNVYLYACSCGLGSVVRGSFDGKKLSKLLGLAKEQFVTLCHSVGHPANQ